ncbi:hypothetical protein CCAX7_008680 [Capsulimonas corticalis]|uniref:Uncharacterized protein n=1 Tax=Capsulimonas corticalis TaxID=2219043 RepID=A0A402CU00_9BACT|nr:WD40 repeat domain-containing protein [Capsulimonas corticalis]BDI28817.1 hypothetical protein CCAX7_008680 [Capsulimonas corticalis]
MRKLPRKHLILFATGWIAALCVMIYWRMEYVRSHDPLQIAFVPSSNGYGTEIDRMAFSPDGHRIIAEDVGQSLSVWDIRKRQWALWLNKKRSQTPEYQSLAEPQFPKQYYGRYSGVYFPPDIPNFPPPKPIHKDTPDHLFSLSNDDFQTFSDLSASRKLIAYGYGNGILSVANIPRKRVLFATPSSHVESFPDGGGVYADTLCGLCFSPDEKLLATVSIHNDVSDYLSQRSSSDSIPGPDLQIALRDPHTGAVIRNWTWKHFRERWTDTVGGNTTPVTMTFSPDSRTLAIASETQVRLWNTATGISTRTLYDGNGTFKWTHRLVFFPHRPLLASSGWSGRLQIWNTQSGRLVQVFQAQPENYYGLEVAVSPDEKLIANSGRTEKGTAMLQIWDVSKL